jgi:nitroreductase
MQVTPESSDSPALDPMSLRLAAANALIRRRRTIKPQDMDDRPVDPRLLAAILENANWAPSHGLTEPWRFFVFTGEGRARLADFCQSLYRRLTPDEAFREEKFEKLRTQPLKAPVVVAIGMKRQEGGKIPEIEEVEAVACAVQNMQLTASALGMAAFWATPPLVYSDEMRAWLGLPDPSDKCLGLLYLGWPRSQAWPEGRRGEIAAKVVHVAK